MQKKRIRYGVKAMQAMQNEIAIRNTAIDQLESDVQTYLSEKMRLGDTNAWLTEQNDALKKEVIEANRSFENSEARNKGLRNANSAYARAHDKAQAEQAQTALRLYTCKASAIVAAVVAGVLGAIIVFV